MKNFGEWFRGRSDLRCAPAKRQRGFEDLEKRRLFAGPDYVDYVISVRGPSYWHTGDFAVDTVTNSSPSGASQLEWKLPNLGRAEIAEISGVEITTLGESSLGKKIGVATETTTMLVQLGATDATLVTVASITPSTPAANRNIFTAGTLGSTEVVSLELTGAAPAFRPEFVRLVVLSGGVVDVYSITIRFASKESASAVEAPTSEEPTTEESVAAPSTSDETAPGAEPPTAPLSESGGADVGSPTSSTVPEHVGVPADSLDDESATNRSTPATSPSTPAEESVPPSGSDGFAGSANNPVWHSEPFPQESEEESEQEAEPSSPVAVDPPANAAAADPTSTVPADVLSTGSSTTTSSSDAAPATDAAPSSAENGQLAPAASESENLRLDTARKLAALVFEGYDSTESGKQPIGIFEFQGSETKTYLVTLSGTDLRFGQATGLSQDVLSALGAADYYRAAAIAAILEKIPAGATIILAGHSLGGMEAQNLVRDLIDRGYLVPTVITFGSPVTAAEVPGTRYVRFMTQADIVPSLSIAGYALHKQAHPEQIHIPGNSNWHEAHMEYKNSSALEGYDALGNIRTAGDGTSLTLRPVARRSVPAPFVESIGSGFVVRLSVEFGYAFSYLSFVSKLFRPAAEPDPGASDAPATADESPSSSGSSGAAGPSLDIGLWPPVVGGSNGAQSGSAPGNSAGSGDGDDAPITPVDLKIEIANPEIREIADPVDPDEDPNEDLDEDLPELIADLDPEFGYLDDPADDYLDDFRLDSSNLPELDIGSDFGFPDFDIGFDGVSYNDPSFDDWLDNGGGYLDDFRLFEPETLENCPVCGMPGGTG